MTRVVSLHRAHALSGVSVAGARLAGMLPGFVPMLVGESLTDAQVLQSPFSNVPSVLCCAWPKGATPIEQLACVRQALLDARADVVLTNDLPHGALAAATEPRIRCAGLFHGDHPRDHEFYQLVAPLCDAWTGVSESIVRTVSANLGANAKRVFEPSPCPMDVPPEPVPPNTSGPLKLLFAGWLDGNKRPLDLPLLCEELVRLGVRFELVVAGDGPLRDELARRTQGHTQADRVRLLGRVDRSEMDALFKWCDGLVLTSQSEGCPLVVMEAMAAGRIAAVSTGSGGARDAINHGVDGLIFEIGDMPSLAQELASLAKDRSRLARMGRTAHALAHREFAQGACVPRFNRLFASAMAAPAGDPMSRWPAFVRTLGFLGECSVGDLQRARALYTQANEIDEASLPLEVARLVPPRERLVRAAIDQLSRSGCARIAIYGAGAHTRAVVPVFMGDARVVAIVDDEAASGSITTMHGLSIVRPERAIEMGIDAVLLSSDGFEVLLAERAAEWAKGLPVLGLYTHALERSLQLRSA